MERLEQLHFLIDALMREMPQYRGQAAGFGPDAPAQYRLLRSLMNVRPPMPLDEEFLRVQDELLCALREEKGVVDAMRLPPTAADGRLALWRGDITRLRADAIVNAANSGLLGCFIPCHGCIDNAIHTAAGLQLRQECQRLMQAQGHEEPAGRAKRTGGYNLPCRWVLHTVGPIVSGPLGEGHCRLLAACYRACLQLAAREGMGSLAFCCISTGEFHFPRQRAAEIAVAAVREFLAREGGGPRVIFNVYQEADYAIYRELLGPDRAAATKA